jgi:hypothetical protein
MGIRKNNMVWILEKYNSYENGKYKIFLEFLSRTDKEGIEEYDLSD